MEVSKPKRVSGHPQPKPYLGSLDQPGRVRIANLMVMLNVSHSTIYDRLKSGGIPKPDGRDPLPYWLTSTVKTMLEPSK